MSDHRETDVPAKEHRHIKTRDDLRVAIVDLITHARREIAICSPALDPALYSHASLAEALGHYIARQARGRVCIVVEDTEHMLLSSVRLVELARRFSDRVLIQRLGEPHHGMTEMFIVADSESCLYQQDITVIDAMFDLQAPHLARPLARRFEDIWAASEPVPGLHGFRL
jgi:regulator of extracellular matrix RemA (YlzA/DUF370 family)